MLDQMYRLLEPRDALRPYVRRILVVDKAQSIDVTVKPAPTGFNYFGWVFSGAVEAAVDGTTFPFAKNCLQVADKFSFRTLQ